MNTAKCMLGLLLGKTWPLFPVFNQFLEVGSLTHAHTHTSIVVLLCVPAVCVCVCVCVVLYMCVSQQQSKYKVMNKDQWYNVLEFSRTVNADLSNYDEDGACEYTLAPSLSLPPSLSLSLVWVITRPCCLPAGPVLLDEFVEWQKARSSL